MGHLSFIINYYNFELVQYHWLLIVLEGISVKGRTIRENFHLLATIAFLVLGEKAEVMS